MILPTVLIIVQFRKPRTWKFGGFGPVGAVRSNPRNWGKYSRSGIPKWDRPHENGLVRANENGRTRPK